MTTTPPLTAVNQRALEAVVSGYYPQILDQPATSRARAQTAYTIASATAAALVTAGILTHISDYRWWVQAAGAASLAAWLVSAALFIRVSKEAPELPHLAKSSKDDQGRWKLVTATDFVDIALSAASDAAEKINNLIGAAVITTWVALVLTALALFTALASPVAPETVDSIVVLTPQVQAAVAKTCAISTGTISGKLDIDSLNNDYAVIAVSKGGCQPDKAVVLRIPPKQIEAVESNQD